MNRPLVAVVGAYAAGLLLAPWFHPPLAELIGVFSLVLLLVLACLAGARRRQVLILAFKKHRLLLLWPLLALAGWLNFTARTAVVSPADLRVLLGQEPAVATVRGTL